MDSRQVQAAAHLDFPCEGGYPRLPHTSRLVKNSATQTSPLAKLPVMNRFPLIAAGRAVSLLLLISLVGLVSCASTPQSRIERHPEMFSKLSNEDKELVLRGGLREGLHKDGVFIAWGAPASIMSGQKSGKSFDRWRYTRMEPVFVDNFAFYGPVGLYHHGRRHHGYHGMGYAPSVYYVPYVAAIVSFENNQVVSWQRER